MVEIPPPGTPPPGTPPPPDIPPPGEGPGGVENDAGAGESTSTQGVDSASLTIKARERQLIDRLYNMVNAAHDWMIFVAANGGLTPEDVWQVINDFEKIVNDPKSTAKEKEVAKKVIQALKEALKDPAKGGAHYLIFILSDPAKYLSDAGKLSELVAEQDDTVDQATALKNILSRDLRNAGLGDGFDLGSVPPSIQNLAKKFLTRTLISTQASNTAGGGSYYVLNTARLKYLQDQMMNKLSAAVSMAGILQQARDVFYDMWIALIDPYLKKPSASFSTIVGKLMKTWTIMFKRMVTDSTGYKDRFNNATYEKKKDDAYDDAISDAEGGAWGWIRQLGDYLGGGYVKAEAMPHYYEDVVAIENERATLANNEAAAIKKVLFNISGELGSMGDELSQDVGDQIRGLLDGDISSPITSSMIEDRSGEDAGFIGMNEDKAAKTMSRMANLVYTRDIVSYLNAKAKEMFSDIMRSLLEMPKRRSNLDKIMEVMKLRQGMQTEWVSRYIESLQAYCQFHNNYVQANVELEKAKERAKLAALALYIGMFTGFGSIILSGLWYKIIVGFNEDNMTDYDNYYEEGGLEIDPGKIILKRPGEDFDESEVDRLNRLERMLAYYLGRMNANYNPSLITSEPQDFSGIDQTQLVSINMLIDNIITTFNMVAQIRETMGKVKSKIWASVFKLERTPVSQDGQVVEYMQSFGDIAKMKAGIQLQATNEKVQELNKQRAEELKAELAYTDAVTATLDVIACVLAIIGACLMCTPAAVVGFALIAVAAILAIISAAIKYDSAKDNYEEASKIDIKSDSNIININQQQNESSLMEASENERIANTYERLYNQMLRQVNALNVYSARTGAGDGYYALDIGVISKAGKLIAHLSIAQFMVMNLQVARDRAREAIWEILFDLEASSKTKQDVIKAITMRSFSTVMDVLQARVGQIKTELEALNRKEYAQKALDAAEISLIIACATAPVKVALAYLGAFVEGLQVVITVVTLLLTLAESIINIAIAVDNANDSLGGIEKKQQEALAALEAAFSNESDPMMELIKECLKDVNTGLVTSTAGGRVTYKKSNVIRAKHRVEKIFKDRELIKDIREAANQVWQETFTAMNGFASVRTDMAMVNMADEALKQLALKSIDNLESNIKSKVERLNQINDAERKMWTTIVTSAINIIASAASVAAAGGKASPDVTKALTYASIAASFLGNLLTNLIYDATREYYKPTKSKVGTTPKSAVDMGSQAMAAELTRAERSLSLTIAMDQRANTKMYGQIIAQAIKQLAIQLVKDLIKGNYQHTGTVKDNERQIEILTEEKARLEKALKSAKGGDAKAIDRQIKSLDEQIRKLETQITQCKDSEKRKLLEGKLAIMTSNRETLTHLKTYAEVMKEIEVLKAQREKLRAQSKEKEAQEITNKIERLETKRVELQKKVLEPIEARIKGNTQAIESKHTEIAQRIKSIKAGKFKALAKEDKQLIAIVADSSPKDVAKNLSAFMASLPKSFRADAEIMGHFRKVLSGGIASAYVDGKMSSSKLAAMEVWIQEQSGALAQTKEHKADLTNTIISIVEDRMSQNNMNYVNEFLGEIAVRAQNPQNVFQNFSSTIKAQGRSSFDTVTMEMLIAAAMIKETQQSKAQDMLQKCDDLMSLFQQAKMTVKTTSKEDVPSALGKYIELIKGVVEDKTFVESFKATYGKDWRAKYKELKGQIEKLESQVTKWEGKPPSVKQLDNAFITMQAIQAILRDQIKSDSMQGAKRGTDLRIMQSILINVEVAGFIAIIRYSDKKELIGKALQGLSELNELDLVALEEGEQSSREVTRILQSVRDQNKELFNKIMGELVDQGHTRLAGDTLVDIKGDIAVQIIQDWIRTKKKKGMKVLKELIEKYKDSSKTTKAQKTAIRKLIAGLFANIDLKTIKQAEQELPEGEKTFLQVLSASENKELATEVIGALVDAGNDEKAAKILGENFTPEIARKILGGLEVSRVADIIESLASKQLIRMFKDDPEALANILTLIPYSSLNKVIDALIERDKSFSLRVVYGFDNSKLMRALAAKVLEIKIPEDVTVEHIQGVEPKKAMLAMLYVSSSSKGIKHFKENILPKTNAKTFIDMFNENPLHFAVYFGKLDSETQKILAMKIFKSEKNNVQAYIKMFNRDPELFAFLISKCDMKIQKEMVTKIFRRNESVAARLSGLLEGMLQSDPGRSVTKEKVKTVSTKRSFNPEDFKSDLFKRILSDPKKQPIEQFIRALEENDGELIKFFDSMKEPGWFNSQDLKCKDMLTLLKKMDDSKRMEFIALLEQNGIKLPVQFLQALAHAVVTSIKLTADQRREEASSVFGLMDDIEGAFEMEPEETIKPH